MRWVPHLMTKDLMRKRKVACQQVMLCLEAAARDE
jgi:hypothetical protein